MSTVTPCLRAEMMFTMEGMIRYGFTIFLSAFLLFQIQPMIARFILPWFGGTAAVWTTCMMFFQVVLLLGYLYSHLLRRTFSPKWGWLIHLSLLAVAVCLLTVSPPERLKPSGDENVTIAIIQTLVLTIGLPFFVLSTTGPLVQAWQSSTHSRQSPYRLYALSNLGSMLALVSYPFLVERFLPLDEQAMIWSVGFLLFALNCCWSGWQTVRLDAWEKANPEVANEEVKSRSNIGVGRILLWVLLPMAASIMLLATTNLMCQEVASVPFLWILPLCLYLLSFIICFDRPALYRRRVFTPLLIFATFFSVALIYLAVYAGLLLQIIGLAMVCFSAAMTCHGELERLKPETENLTAFYLWIAVGGALGGVFVCVIAPMYFTGFYEFHIGLMICLVVALGTIVRFGSSKNREPQRKLVDTLVATGVFAALGLVCSSLISFLNPDNTKGLVFQGRNEYGLASVVDVGDYRRFINGRIEHGGQSLEPDEAMSHTGYYVSKSGVGVAFNSYRAQTDAPLKVGVVGLGAGAMATWLEPGDEAVFFEINPMVEMIAANYFSYLDNAAGDCTVKLGDGRIQLQREIGDPSQQPYDLLMMDAFSSDSIPVHLLTRECFEIYLQRLKPNGVLVAHITNRFVDLRPVIHEHANQHGLTPLLIDYESEDKKFKTHWVLLTRNENVIHSPLVNELSSPWPESLEPILWTDDYASMASVMDWSIGIDWERIRNQLQDAKPKQVTASQSE
jgi:predicted O-methyltransferase YrrM